MSSVTFSERQSIYIFSIASILLHMFILVLAPHWKKSAAQKEPFNPIILESLDAEKLLPGKIVDLINNDKALETDKKTKYFSDQNRLVDKETKARLSTSVPQSTPSNVEKITPKNPSELIPNEKSKESLSLEVPANPPSIYPGRESLEKLTLPYDPNNIDAPLSDETRLNTKTFLYSSFFTRIKRQIAMHWRPEPAFNEIQKLNPYHPPPLVVTRVFIYLNTQGELISVYVSKSSGYLAWDNEALRAVKAASPFRNPPIGVFNEYGAINFEFGFLGEINRSIFEQSIE
jgi:TonB family protein